MKSAHIYAVGFLFFLGLAAVGYFTIVRKKPQDIAESMHIPVLLKSAEGLKLGAPVYCKGVRLGFVSALEYISEEGRGQKVYAVLSLNQRLQFFGNYRIATRYPTLLSEKSVEIDPGSGKTSSDRLSSVIEFSTEETTELRVKGIFPVKPGEELRSNNFDDPLYLIATVMNDNRQDIRRITHNLAEITEKINEGDGTLALLVNQGALVNHTNAILKDVIILVQEVRGGVEDTRESRAAIDFIGAFFVSILRAGAGLPAF